MRMLLRAPLAIFVHTALSATQAVASSDVPLNRDNGDIDEGDWFAPTTVTDCAPVTARLDGNAVLMATPSSVNALVKLLHCATTVDAKHRVRPTPDDALTCIAESETHSVLTPALSPTRAVGVIDHWPA